MKRFRDPVVAREQVFLLPPAVNDFVPPNAPVRILSEIVDQLDCSALYARYQGGGAPAYEPRMMLKVLLFGYSQGLRSSRKLSQALEYDLRFIFLAEMSRPDFHTLCRFRRDNEAAIVSLFVETVRLAKRMGLVLLKHAAIDGTKVEANVARRRVVDGEQIERRIGAIEAIEEEIHSILREAEAADSSEDDDHGSSRGDEVPEELNDLRARKERLERARKLLAQEGGKTVATTDPESRLMRTRVGCRAAYNAQAVVDEQNQIIVAADVTQQEADNAQLPSLLDQTKANCGQLPEQVSADTGYWSTAALEYASNRKVDAYIPAAARTPRQKAVLCGWTYDPTEDVFQSDAGERMYFNRERERDGRQYRVYRKCSGGRKEVWVRSNGLLADAMRAKLASPQGRAIYQRRQQIVEPVFGHLKAVLGLRRLLLRGLNGARIEYMLACSAHNLGKIIRQTKYATA
jgi:transposase